MSRQPLLILLLCFIAGIAYREAVALSDSAVYAVLASGGLAAATGFIRALPFQRLKAVLLGIFFFTIGIFIHHLNSPTAIASAFEGKQDLVFEIRKKHNSTEKYRRYEAKVLQLNGRPVRLGAVFSLPKSVATLDFAHYYRAKAYVNQVRAPENDFQFDYARYLRRKDIYYQSFINGDMQAVAKKRLTLQDRISQRRFHVLRRIDQSYLPQRTREFLKGIILADRTEMDAQTVSDFNRTGLVHLLAISGTHMAVIFWLVMLLLRKTTPPKFRSIPIVLSLVFIWLFAVFIDYGSSVMRSCIMITAYYGFVLLQRKPDLLHAAALAGFAILIVDTQQLFDVGFQLSFLAVLGIFWLNQPILSCFGTIKNKALRFLANILSVSLSAQLATLPLILYYFHQYSPVSVVANLVVIPFSEIIILFSLMLTGLFALNFEFAWLNWLYDGVVNLLLKTTHYFAESNTMLFDNIAMTALEAALLLAVVYCVRKVLLRRIPSSWVPLGFAALSFLMLRTVLNLVAFKHREVVAAGYFKSNVLIVKSGNKADLFAPAELDSVKIKKYILDPYLASKRISNSEVHRIPEGAHAVAVNGHIFPLK